MGEKPKMTIAQVAALCAMADVTAELQKHIDEGADATYRAQLHEFGDRLVVFATKLRIAGETLADIPVAESADGGSN